MSFLQDDRDQPFCKLIGCDVPIICGPMYPCSNPELVAAVSNAGGIGIIQPLSLVFVHKHEFREGLQYIKKLTSRPVGMNIIVEKSSKKYEKRMREWMAIALEEGVRFFVTSLGNPTWVLEQAHACGGVVYHDVTELRWAKKACDYGVDGLICVNDDAGGHSGGRTMEELVEELAPLGVPLVAAGGIATSGDFRRAMDLGYSAVQMGTRFIAASECSAHSDYKSAIAAAAAEDIVHTDRISGVPVAVINTPYVQKQGIRAGLLARYLLRQNKTKHWMRLYYMVRSLFQLRASNRHGGGYRDYYQAGRSVRGISKVLTCQQIIDEITSPSAKINH